MKLVLRIFLPVVVLGASAYGIYWMMHNKPVQESRPRPVLMPLVEGMPLVRSDVQIVVRSQGPVRPRLRTALVSQVAGRIVERSENLRDGARFAEGDILLKLDAAEYEIAVKLSEATLAKATLLVTEARLQEKRTLSDVAVADAAVATAQVAVDEETARGEQAMRDWQTIHPGKAPAALAVRKPQLAAAQAGVRAAAARLEQSRVDHELAAARIATAEAAVLAAQADLDRRRLDLARTVIKAPYSGRVLMQKVDLGGYIMPGAELATIYPDGEAEIRLPCDAGELAWLDLPVNADGPFPKVTLTGEYGGRSYQWIGEVRRTEGAIDNESRQLSLIVAIEKPFESGPDGRPPLRIGQFLTAEINGTTLPKVFELPRSAVRFGNEILLVKSDNTLVRELIKPLYQNSQTLIVAGPFADDVRLCLTNLPFITEGATVRVKGDPMPEGMGGKGPGKGPGDKGPGSGGRPDAPGGKSGKPGKPAEPAVPGGKAP